MTEDILLMQTSHSDRVVHLVLNNAEQLNAMSLEMAMAFRKAKSELESRADLRAVVISGRGRAFSAGGDLQMLRRKADKSVSENRDEMLWFYRSFLSLRELNVPLICALHGHVVGAGFCFAAACDSRIADETVLLSAPFTRLALHPGMGGSYFLPLTLGTAVATDLMLTGRRMNAEEALRHGFVSRVVEAGGLAGECETLLDQMMKSAPQATRAMLESRRSKESSALNAALETEAMEQAVCYSRPEFVDGVEALMEKRSPAWL